MNGFFLHKDVIKYLATIPDKSERRKIVGAGSFLVPNPGAGVGRRHAIHVANITYVDAVARSIGCLESTWVPNHFGTLEERKMRTAACGSPCQVSGDCDITSACVFCDLFDGCVG